MSKTLADQSLALCHAIEECEVSDLDAREAHYIEINDSIKNGYNTASAKNKEAA